MSPSLLRFFRGVFSRQIELAPMTTPDEGSRGAKIDLQHGMRQLLDSVPAAAYLCDPQGLITYCNTHAAELWGRAPKLNDAADRFCGSFELYSADGTPIRHEQSWMAVALQTGQEVNKQEIVIVQPNGQRVTALAHASPIRGDDGQLLGAINVLVDISDRKRAERDLITLKDQLAAQLADLRRLHEMTMRLSTTLELRPILEEVLRTAAAIEGTDMGLISLCDEEHQQLVVGASLGFGESALQEIAQVPVGSAACGTAYQRRRRVVVEDVDTDPLFENYRPTARRAGFRAVHSTPLVARDGKALGVLSTHFRRPHKPNEREVRLIDLCARQAVDFIENARLYEQLREVDRRKDEFLATLAHELRNPLAPISNSLHLLGMSDVSPAVERVREIMERQVNQMVRLVDDLLEISRISNGKIVLRKETVELAAVARNAVEASRPLMDSAGHQLAISLPADPIVLSADPMRLAQVLANLLNNAAKYTPDGGQIWLAARVEGSEAVVSVRDTGVGIRAEMLPRVFDMFAQVDRSINRSQGGLGIGLSLARRLVELHEGRLEARSPGPGQGSEFIMRLPLAIERPLFTPPAAPPTSVPNVRRFPARRILVVDDARDAVYLVGKMLETMGQVVHTTQNAYEALEFARAERPDVVISDIGMPQISGYELARLLRREPGLEKTVLVALTGYSQESDRQGTTEAGFDHHLVKPVSLDALQRLLESLPAPGGKLLAN